jgi:hypothetical protein
VTVTVIGKWSENPFRLTGFPIPPSASAIRRETLRTAAA